MAGRRRKNNWNYKVLGTTGERVPCLRSTRDRRDEAISVVDKMSDETGVMKFDVTPLLQAEEGIFEEISDFLEENRLPEAFGIDEIDENVGEIKELRKEFKRVHRQLKSHLENYGTELKENYDDHCKKITDYITRQKRNRKLVQII